MAVADAIVGRDTELDAIRDFLERPTAGRALLLHGEPGIGKSTLWRACVAFAPEQGYVTLVTRPTESEAKFSYMGLVDLLEHVEDGVLDRLPGPQRSALRVALLRAEAPPEGLDHRTVSVAALGVLRAMAASDSLLVAIDDVQWLDGPTALVLEFVARRLGNEPIRFVAALRAAPGVSDPIHLARTLGEGQLQTLGLAGLSAESLIAVLHERLGATFPRPTMNRVVEASGGNPFFALEIARALIAGRLQLEPGRLVFTGQDLADLLPARLTALSPSTQELLLICSAASAPTIALLRSVVTSQRVSSDLAAAVGAGVIELEAGRIRFTHPLLSAAVYSEVSDERRRMAHRRLAAVVNDQEEQARHAALAANAPDTGVAAYLEDAAEHARRRGAPGTASELCALAAALTPAENALALRRLLLRSASDLLLAGDPQRALDAAAEIVTTAPPGPERAEALSLTAVALHRLDEIERWVQVVDELLVQPGALPELLSAAHSWRAWFLLGHDLPKAAREAEEAVRLADGTDDATTIGMAIAALIMVRTASGSPVPSELSARALELDDAMQPFMVSDRPRGVLAVRLMHAGELDEARRILLRLLDEAKVKGDELSVWDISQMLGRLERLAGNWKSSLEYHTGGSLPGEAAALPQRALVLAYIGETARAEAVASKALEAPFRRYDLGLQVEALGALGFIDLSRGDAAGALEHLDAAWEIHQGWGIGDPALSWFVADRLEALIELGRHEDARAVLRWLENRGEILDHPWALGVVARCSGLLAAARGDFPAALDSLDEAQKHHQRLPMPFELGRTLLVQGSIRRRAKQKRPAREAIDQAIEIFERLGAPLWAAKARAELGLVSGRRPVAGQLTPGERRVARLAAAGRTNREIAEALFTSPRTVSAHLSHIYAKLGIRSRNELGRIPDLLDESSAHS